jgi:hypothetical protein
MIIKLKTAPIYQHKTPTKDQLIAATHYPKKKKRYLDFGGYLNPILKQSFDTTEFI